MRDLIFEGYSKYGDTGIADFSFIYKGDRYKVFPRHGVPGSSRKLEQFMKFVKYIAPKSGGNPWLYRVNPDQKFSRVFTIYKNGIELKENPEPPQSAVIPSPKPPKSEQLSLPLTAGVDRLSNRLEALGCLKEAYQLDIIANTLDRWLSNNANLFFDEIVNQGIEPDTACKVLDLAKKFDVK